MSRLISIIGLQIFAFALAFAQSLPGGVRTDEAKYLLNIPYPQPPLARWILGLTESLSFQDILWRIIFATLLVQAVWLVWDLSRDLPKEQRFILASGWLLSAGVLFQAGTVMMAPLTALFGLIFVWLALRERGTALVVGLLWLASLFTAYQGVLYLPLVVWMLRKRKASLFQLAIYIDLSLAVLALYTLANPLALASFLNAGGENLNIPFVMWFWYLLRLWITGGSLALTILGITGMIRSRNWGLIGAFLLTSAFCLVSFREYYDILFTPLFIGGAYLLLKDWKPRITIVPFLIVLLGSTALTYRFLPPIVDLGPARETMQAIENRNQTGDVLINKYFGHEWQWESNLTIRRFKPALVKNAQAVICINQCEGFDVKGWVRLPGVSVEVWVKP